MLTSLLLEARHRTYQRGHYDSSTKKTILTKIQPPNNTILGYSNRLRVRATRNREHNCHDSFTLCRGCTHSPQVVIILGSQAPIDLIEYFYTLPGCALGRHYKDFLWLSLVCSSPTEVSPEVSVQTTKAPLLRHVVLRRVHFFTHSFPTRWIHRESTLPAPPIGMRN
jgi:hypothetical protein